MSLTSLSPGVITKETDLSQFIGSVGSSGGATVGQFVWGPVLEYTILADANDLVSTFGKPNNTNFADWFSCFNFLSYTNDLNVIRVVDEASAKNSSLASVSPGLLVKNDNHYHTISGTSTSHVMSAKYPGALGNSLKVSIADKDNFDSWTYKNLFDFAPATSESASSVGAANDEIHLVVVDEDGLFTGVPGQVLEKYAFLSKALDAKGLDGQPTFYGFVLNEQSKYVWYFAPPLTADITNNVVNSVTLSSGGTGYHQSTTTATITGDGTGATATVTVTGGVITAVTITNKGSGYTTASIAFNDTNATPGTGAVGACVLKTFDLWGQNRQTSGGAGRDFAPLKGQYAKSFAGGADGSAVDSADLIAGWDMFKQAEEVDVSLLFLGTGGGEAVSGGSTVNAVTTQYVIDNIAESRKDCVVFYSPNLVDVLNKTQSQATANVIDFKESVARSSSYAVMDSGWKLQFDQFNNVYRWVPLNADVAGLCARTDYNQDAWWSPAGLNRGKIKNVVSLAFNPNKTARDDLYKSNINSIVTFKGDGTVLYGDKTTLAKDSAFSYINVRRLFLVMEKAISKAARYQLFEFNDSFTRAQFRTMVEPYLREIKGRRGLYDFRVVCDETNNTPEVIDRAEFVASIFVKPARSINVITLNFVNTRTGVEFSEVTGAV